MIDPDLIDQLDEDMAKSVRVSLAVIAQSGIIKTQIARSFAQFSLDADQMDELVLAKALQENRKIERKLLELQAMGESFIKREN